MRAVISMGRLINGCHSGKMSSTTSAALYSTFFQRQKMTCVQMTGCSARRRDSLCVSPSKDRSLCFNIQRTMAGHSHWQNIRHTKGANDAKYMATVESFIGLMKGAIADGGPNPDNNKRLADLITRMQKASIPKADIKRYLENATKKAAMTQTMYSEIRGPAGSIFVLEVDSENPKVSKDLVRTLVKKTTGRLQQGQTFEGFFDMKGVVTVPVTKDMQVSNMDEYLEIAIETGAEDVILTKNDEAEDGDPEHVLKFHCDQKTYRKVAKEIEETYSLEVSSCQVELFPHNWVSIDSESDIAECKLIAEKLYKHKEFVNLFDNISLPEDR